MNTDRRAECHVECSCPPQHHYPFAPGVIEGPSPGTNDGWVVELVIVAIALGALVAALGFALGYLNLAGWLA